jgi:hypothetical protein
MNTNHGQDELIPRYQAAKFLREQFPETGACAIPHACWRAYSDGREECPLAELIEALRYYQPQPRRDFRLKK